MFYIVQQDIIILAFYLKLNIYIYILETITHQGEGNEFSHKDTWWVCRRSAIGAVWVGSSAIWCERVWERWRDDLAGGATISLLSLLSLYVSLFARGPKMARRSRWSVTRFDEGGFERSERCDRLTPMRSSCSNVGNLLALSLSLSLLFSKAGNHLKWKWKRKSFSTVLAIFYGHPKMLFSLTKFEVTTKHPLFRKIISGISLKSKQMEPKLHHNFTQNSIYSTTPYNTILFFK